MSSSSFSWRRVLALCGKESHQIVRDPSSIVIAFILPIIMLFIYGYGLNLDSGDLRLGLVLEDKGPEAQKFSQALQGSSYVDLVPKATREEAIESLRQGNVRGVIIIPQDFSLRIARNRSSEQPAPVTLFTDGSEPNVASFAQAYTSGVWQVWQQQFLLDKGLNQNAPPNIPVVPRFWFNPNGNSRNFLVPGSISLIMTVIGALLSSLIVAREWERGTMEALLSTPLTRVELLLSKFIPYFFLGIISLLICVAVTIFIIGIPFRGNLLALLIMSSLFLTCALGTGLLISTRTKDQFLAAQGSLVMSYLPAMLLSGFVFEINSMPTVIRLVTYLIPAKYFVSSLQCIFQAGVIWEVLLENALFMIAYSIIFFALIYRATRGSLEKNNV